MIYFLNILSLCDAIRNGFLNTATVKFYAGTDKNRSAEVLGSVWLLAAVLTAILLVLNAGAFFFIGYTHNEELIVTIKWLGLTYLSTLPFSVVFWILQAEESYAKILWLRLVNSGSMILSFIILGVMHRLTLESAIIWNFLTNCLTSGVAILFGMGKIKSVFKVSKECALEIMHYGKYNLATSLSSTLLRSTDTFFLNAMLGSAAVAIYNWPVKLMEIVEIPLRSFVSTGMSTMAAAYNKKDMNHVSHILKKYSGMLTIAFIPLALIVLVFADVAINIFAGSKFTGTEAANMYRFFMFIAIMYPIDRFNGVTLDIIHKPKLNFYKVLIMLAVSVVTDYVAISLLGNIYGVVVGVFMITLAGVVFGYFSLRRHVSYTIPEIFMEGLNETKLFLQKNLKFLRPAP